MTPDIFGQFLIAPHLGSFEGVHNDDGDDQTGNVGEEADPEVARLFRTRLVVAQEEGDEHAGHNNVTEAEHGEVRGPNPAGNDIPGEHNCRGARTAWVRNHRPGREENFQKGWR